jgi:hypothetical protein
MISGVPSGTQFFLRHAYPALETPGYCQMSLWDTKARSHDYFLTRNCTRAPSGNVPLSNSTFPPRTMPSNS